jgi:hypothetical protein
LSRQTPGEARADTAGGPRDRRARSIDGCHANPLSG